VSFGDRARAALERLEAQSLRRAIPETNGLVDFASNDYLGLATNADVLAAMRRVPAVGSAGSRLLSGAHAEHHALENELAAFVKRERALLFSSGYLAALGVLDGLGRLFDDCYSDELNHASLIDGVRLSRMRRHIYAHGELPPVASRARPAAIVTESLFGMSGRVEDLERIVSGMGADDVVLVDEAHALGVFGSDGSGFASEFADPRIVVLGTLSKSFGCSGGFVAGPAEFIEFLISTARSFIFDTSLPLPIVAAARASLERIACGDDLRARLFANVAQASRSFAELGLYPSPTGPIASIVLGEPERALGVAAALRAEGLYVPAIRPPTVPPGTSRLRVTFNANHRPQEIDRLFACLARALPAPLVR